MQGEAGEVGMDTDKNRHSKIIRSLCREILIPLGVFQKGNSRVYFDDNGYCLTMVEFQPSAWDRGSYLNVGVHFLWDAHEFFSFDAYAGTDTRVARFVRYENDAQFEIAMRNMAMVAKEHVLHFRNPENVEKTLCGGRSRKHYPLYLAYHGRIEEARAEYLLFMENPRFQRAAEEWGLPETADELTQDFVVERVRLRRKALHEKPNMKKLPWNEALDGKRAEGQ